MSVTLQLNRMIQRLRCNLQECPNLSAIFYQMWGSGQPPMPQLAVCHDVSFPPSWMCPSGSGAGLREADNGLLWAVPKFRRSLEVRMTRRYGVLNCHYKMIKVNKKIRLDYQTGEHYVMGELGRKTFKKVMAETAEIKKKIADVFTGMPIDREVAVTYSTVADDDHRKTSPNLDGMNKTSLPTTDEFGNCAVQIDMEKPLPKGLSMFSLNLLQRTTKLDQTDRKSTAVRTPMNVVAS